MQSPPPAPCPPIDDRSYDDVVRDTEALLEAYTTVESPDGESGWSPSAGPDVGSALARIFARMAKHVITRLNRAPDRSYLAFLNLIGIEPSSPRPALAPLTFSLAKGGAAEPLVPAGTRVGAKPAVSSAPDVTFQTTADVTLSRAKLASAIVLEPSKNRYSDRTAEATGEVAGYYPVFSGRASIPHSLYIAADPILSAPSGAEIIVTLLFEAGGASTFKALHEGQAPAVTWSYWNGSAWAPIP